MDIQNIATLLTIWPAEYASASTYKTAGEWFDQWLTAASAGRGTEERQEFIRALFTSLRAHMNAAPADALAGAHVLMDVRKVVQSCARAIINSSSLAGAPWYDIMREFPDLMAARPAEPQPREATPRESTTSTMSPIRMGPGVCTNMESLLRAVKDAIERNDFVEVFNYISAVGNECFSSMLKHVPAPAFLKLHSALIAEPEHTGIAFTPRYVKSYLTARMITNISCYLSCGNAWHNLAESINGEKYASSDGNHRALFCIRNGALMCEIMLPRGHVIYTAILVNNRDIKLYLH